MKALKTGAVTLVTAAIIFSFSQKKLEAVPFFPNKKPLVSGVLQQDSLKSDSLKTNADSLQSQKSDSLQSGQLPKIVDEMKLPESLGGGKITLFVGKVRHAYKNEEGAPTSVTMLIKELESGAKITGYLENYNGKKWVAIEQPDKPGWSGWVLLLSLPGLEGHDFIRK